MDLIAELIAFVIREGQQTFIWTYLLAPTYVLPALLLAVIVWSVQGRPGRLLPWLFPRSTYLHRSTLVDIKLTLFNAAVAICGGFSVFFVGPAVAIGVQDALMALSGTNGITEAAVGAKAWAGAILVFLLQDFCRYWNHSIYHRTSWLWPIHAVHHSAEVLTPLTYMRAHPLFRVTQVFLFSFVVGMVQAAVSFAILGPLPGWVYFVGSAAFSTAFFFGGHLQHSHVWLRFGPVLEHVFISPAQHQVHHSSDPKHHDKNFGSLLAIWDWMFGTLYIPEGYEELTFGIADADGVLAPQAHTGLRTALIGPFVEIWEDIRPPAPQTDTATGPEQAS